MWHHVSVWCSSSPHIHIQHLTWPLTEPLPWSRITTTFQTVILQDYIATWHHELEANGCTPEKSQDHRTPHSGGHLRRSPVPVPAQGRLSRGIKWGCSGLYKVRAWNPSRTEMAQPRWAPAPLVGCPHGEKALQTNSSSFKNFQNIVMVRKNSQQQNHKVSPSPPKQIMWSAKKSITQINK